MRRLGRIRERLGAVLVACLCATPLLTGCGQDRTVPAPADIGRVGPVSSDPHACPRLPAPVPIFDAGEPRAVVRCRQTVQHMLGRGEFAVTVRERAGAGMPELVAALRLPSEPRSDGICTADIVAPTEVAVRTSADLVAILPPTDACGTTRVEVAAAYEHLTWVETSRVRGRQVRSEKLVATGCDAWKDMLAIDGQVARPAARGPVVPTSSTIRVCRYEALYPDGWSPSSNQVVDGRPIGGGTLSPGATRRVTTLLNRSGPAHDCRSWHRHFAVVFSHEGKEPAYVELDGCHRILTSDDDLRQGTKALADLLGAG